MEKVRRRWSKIVEDTPQCLSAYTPLESPEHSPTPFRSWLFLFVSALRKPCGREEVGEEGFGEAKPAVAGASKGSETARHGRALQA